MITIKKLGIAEYMQTWKYQQDWMADGIMKKANNLAISEELLMLSHPHVYTLGKSANANNLLVNQDFLASINANSYKIDRGGDITYHGPGQLVVYPLLDLQTYAFGVRDYVFFLEQIVIDILAEYKIMTSRSKGVTGIWLDEGTSNQRKIAAIGIKCSRFLTMHGLAFNINTDLSYFNHIIPCGIIDKGVTSMQKELNTTIDLEEISDKFIHYFKKYFKNK